MENDALSAEHGADEPLAGPVLPARRPSAPNTAPNPRFDAIGQPEGNDHTGHTGHTGHTRHTGHTGRAGRIEKHARDDRSHTIDHRWLIPTRGAAGIATLGWVVAVVAQMLLLVELVPSFDLGDARHYLVPLDESVWFGATTIVAAVAAGLGWLCWTVAAAFNVRRVSPLATSPLLPMAVYVVGPIIVLAAMLGDRSTRTPLMFAGLAWLGVGHIMVVGSLRSAATRIGALSDEFAKLLWLPMAGITYRLFVNVVLELVPREHRSTGLLFGLGAFGAVFICGMAMSTWRATRSFEQACHRLSTRTLGAVMPSAGVLGEALRRANQR